MSNAGSEYFSLIPVISTPSHQVYDLSTATFRCLWAICLTAVNRSSLICVALLLLILRSLLRKHKTNTKIRTPLLLGVVFTFRVICVIGMQCTCNGI